MKTKIQQRQEGALKRERAIAYSRVQKISRSQPSPTNQGTHSVISLKSQEFDRNGWGWSWLERWMAAKPWETRLTEQPHSSTLEKTPPPKTHAAESTISKQSKSSERSPVKVRKNNMTTRISTRPPMGQATHSSSSPSFDFRNDESSGSSSICTSATPISANTSGLASERTLENSNGSGPNYMNLTESTKAKRKSSNQLSHRVQRQSMDEFQFLKVFPNGDSKSSTGSDPSLHMSRPLCPPSTQLDKNLTR